MERLSGVGRFGYRIKSLLDYDLRCFTRAKRDNFLKYAS